jgi:hypothetical protein
MCELPFQMSQIDPSIQLAESPTQNVTSRRPAASPAERKRAQRQREKEHAASVMWERADWQLFLDPTTLGQKAGAATSDLCRLRAEGSDR